MLKKAVACLKVLVFGWLAVIAFQTAVSFWRASPPPASLIRVEPATVATEKKAASPISGKPAAWVLRGTLTDEESGAWAVFEDRATGRQLRVREGERLGEQRVVRVEKEAVVLGKNEGGRNRELRQNWAQAVSQKKMTPPTAAFVSGGALSQQVGLNEFVVKPPLLQKLNRELPGMLESLGFLAVTLDGGKSGFLIDGEEKGMELFAGLGFEDGDTLVSINGKPLQSLEDLSGAFKKLSRQKEIRVEVNRDDETRILTYFVSD